MSKGVSEIAALKPEFAGILRDNMGKVKFDLVRTSRKKRNSDEVVHNEFGAIRLPIRRSEVCDLLSCEVKHVNSLQQASSSLLNVERIKMIAAKAGWSEADTSLALEFANDKNIRFDFEPDTDNRGRKVEDFIADLF